MDKKNYFNIDIKKLSNGSLLHIINIECIDSDLEELINENISLIHSASEYDLDRTKKILRETFNSEQKPYNVPDVKMGAIAEFFVHLYFINVGFKQECLFQNLEETNSIKKGFDGYYSFNDEEWLMESKSTRSNNNHTETLKKAYKDLSDKVSGKSKNDQGFPISPWDNALKHANLAKTNQNILDNIKKLSEDFIDKKFYSINDFNIIPSSTIFLDNKLERVDSSIIHKEVDIYLKDKQYKKLHAVCVTQKTVNLFLDYLNK